MIPTASNKHHFQLSPLPSLLFIHPSLDSPVDLEERDCRDECRTLQRSLLTCDVRELPNSIFSISRRV